MEGKTLGRLILGMVVLLVGGAATGLGFWPTAGQAGQEKPFWHEKKADSQPVIPRNYTPLPSLAGLIKELRPSVVNVYTTEVIKPKMRQRRQLPNPFEEFFGLNPHDQGGEGGDSFFGGPRGGEMKRNSLGSGFVVSPDGYVLTNAHVVARATEIKVKFADEQEYTAKVVGADEQTDVALLKVEPKKNLPFTYLGDSDKLEVGDWVIAIGNPFGLGHTVTAGIISGKDRSIGQGPFDNFLQTDASINPGNSGGPLFDSSGNVIGINSAIISGGSGVGFAVPINLVKSLVGQLRASGKVTRGWLGVNIQNLTEELAEKFGTSAKSGALVAQVFEDTPADKAGIKSGDVIVAVNGDKVGDSRQLTTRIAGLPPKSKVKLDVLRDGKTRTMQIELGEREQGQALAMGEGDSGGKTQDLGLTVTTLTPEKARRLGVRESIKGLVVEEVDPSGPTSEEVQPGDIILEVDKQRVSGISDFRRVLSQNKNNRKVLLRIQRGTTQLFLVILRDK